MKRIITLLALCILSLSLAQAQSYIVDDNLIDSASVYTIRWSKDQTIEVPGEEAFKLPMGHVVQVQRTLRGNSDYTAFYYLGELYAISSRYLLFSPDNPEGVEDILGDTSSRTNHTTLGRFFGTMTPYWIIASLFVAAIAFMFLGLTFTLLRRIALYVVPVCILLASLLEVWAFWIMGNEAFWWCDKELYGFWGSLFRAIPFVLFVAYQLVSIRLYERLLLGDHARRRASLKPMAISLAICVPLTAGMVMLCSAINASETLTQVLTILTLALSLGVGLFLSTWRNVQAMGRSRGLSFTAFALVYMIASLVAVYGLVLILLRLVVQIALIVGAIYVAVLAFKKGKARTETMPGVARVDHSVDRESLPESSTSGPIEVGAEEEA